MHFYGRVAAENEKMALFNVLSSLIKRGILSVWLLQPIVIVSLLKRE